MTTVRHLAPNGCDLWGVDRVVVPVGLSSCTRRIDILLNDRKLSGIRHFRLTKLKWAQLTAIVRNSLLSRFVMSLNFVFRLRFNARGQILTSIFRRVRLLFPIDIHPLV